jgi:hypothetical protein
VIELILGGLIAAVAVLIVALPFLRDTGEPELLDTSADEELLGLAEERDHALAALKELEFDHRIGNIDDADYRASVGQLRREAAAALQALDRARAARLLSGEEHLEQQEEVERHDHDGNGDGGGNGEAPVDEVAHHVAARREPHERDQGERDPERENDLRQHESS